jgi:hypothetical protein
VEHRSHHLHHVTITEKFDKTLIYNKHSYFKKVETQKKYTV